VDFDLIFLIAGRGYCYFLLKAGLKMACYLRGVVSGMEIESEIDE